LVVPGEFVKASCMNAGDVVVVVELVGVVVVALVVDVVALVVDVVALVVDVVALVVDVVALVVDVVALVVDVVVELELVVVVGVQGVGVDPSQEQSVVLHWSMTDFLHARKSAPVKAPHAELICSEQKCGLHFPAAPASETKTPAASATAANVTTALLAIVEPP
jgi:hypothetical protein